jgi:hypothetical protein
MEGMLVTWTGKQVKINSHSNPMVIKTKALIPLSDIKNNFPHEAYLKLTPSTGRFNRFKLW